MKGDIWKSAIAEHQWDQQHQDGTRVLGRATRPIQVKVKEVLHIERTALTPGSITTGATSYQAAGSLP